MTSGTVKDMVSSVRGRLLNLARQTRKPFDEVLILYGLERFLFRLSQSAHKNDFILKGGLLLVGMGMSQVRPTRDIDLLGLMSADVETVSKAIQEIGHMDFNDGVVYDFSRLTFEPLSPDSEYPGIRFKFAGRLGKARIPMQIDVGFGDSVIPQAKEMKFPTLLDMEPPVIMGYAAETVIAEKFEAALDLADLNSRMKDFYDIWILSQTHFFKGQMLQEAVTATCRRRKTAIRSDAEIFSDEFADRFDKQSQWSAFLSKGPVTDAPAKFSIVMRAFRDFLLPLVRSNEKDRVWNAMWLPAGPWHEQGIR